MKNLLLLALLLGLTAPLSASNNPPAQNTCRETHTTPSDPELVVTAKRIWVLAPETPVKSLLLQVTDRHQRVVAEKVLTSKQTDWSLKVDQLPAGIYDVSVDGKKVATLDKRLPGA